MSTVDFPQKLKYACIFFNVRFHFWKISAETIINQKEKMKI